MAKGKTVFVTVGTTLFDPLIECVTNPLFLNKIAEYGFRNVIVQYGKGKIPQHLQNVHDGDGCKNEPSASKARQDDDRDGINNGVYSGEHKGTKLNSIIHWEVYRFKPSLEEDMKYADLIISHAGAGSVMEGLEHCRKRNKDNDLDSQTRSSSSSLKKLVVVINDKLMNNHQCELAYALEKRNFLFVLPKPEYLLREKELDLIMKQFQPQCFEGGNDRSFGIIVDNFMGYDNDFEDKKSS